MASSEVVHPDMRTRQAEGEQEFDPYFYLEAYRDLAHLTHSQLAKHWNTQGKFEGRLGSRATAHQRIRTELGVDAFAPIEHLALNPDLDQLALTEAEAFLHFIHSGHSEGRPHLSSAPSYLSATNDDPRDCEAGHEVLDAYVNLEGRLPNPMEFEGVVRELNSGTSVEAVLAGLVRHRLQQSRPTSHTLAEHGTQGMKQEEAAWNWSTNVMGTSRHVSRDEWLDARANGAVSTSNGAFGSSDPLVIGDLGCSGEGPAISVIASIFRAEQFLDTFTSDLLNQTMAVSAEVVVVAVQPSASEIATLRRLVDGFGWGELIVVDSRIGIYEAWNRAISIASAPLITNANADDRRAPASLARQVQFMNQHPTVDIGYQDFFYTFEHDATWSDIVLAGVKSHLPPVDTVQLLAGINAPHNAPVWRKELHSFVGRFDESFESAGDFDFWLRCLSGGRVAMKIPGDPTGAYFINPDGLSTRPGGRGVEEFNRISRKYRCVIAGRMPNYAPRPLNGEHRSEALTRGALGIAAGLRGSDSP